MSPRLLTAILLIIFCVVVLLLNNSGYVDIDLRIFKMEMRTSFAFFTFLGLGGLIGFMLR